jgi:hypothetical protein
MKDRYQARKIFWQEHKSNDSLAAGAAELRMIMAGNFRENVQNSFTLEKKRSLWHE